jgi:ADP-heptose:LPS heptosyltransferase
LPTLAGRLAACRAFVGHDSGISHLAAAVGLPGLALWGGTNDLIWRPRSSRFRVVKADGGLEQLSVERVVAELDDLLARPE